MTILYEGTDNWQWGWGNSPASRPSWPGGPIRTTAPKSRPIRPAQRQPDRRFRRGPHPSLWRRQWIRSPGLPRQWRWPRLVRLRRQHGPNSAVEMWDFWRQFCEGAWTSSPPPSKKRTCFSFSPCAHRPCRLRNHGGRRDRQDRHCAAPSSRGSVSNSTRLTARILAGRSAKGLQTLKTVLHRTDLSLLMGKPGPIEVRVFNCTLCPTWN